MTDTLIQKHVTVITEIEKSNISAQTADSSIIKTIRYALAYGPYSTFFNCLMRTSYKFKGSFL